MPTTLPRARVLLLFVAISVYANSLGNGFTYDDNWFIVENPVVTEGLIAEALMAPSWPGARPGVTNYRPIALASFGLEWAHLRGRIPKGAPVPRFGAHTSRGFVTKYEANYRHRLCH